MRYLFAFLLMLPVLAWGQSNLPRCTAAETDWRAERHNCFGTFTWPDGSKYVGEFRNGNRNGQGIEYRTDGHIFRSGRWENGNLVQEIALDTNRFPFRAPVANTGLPPCPEGRHVFTSARWDNCFGTYYPIAGQIYVGEWRDGKWHGLGILYWPNGGVDKSGRWENDRLVQAFPLDTSRFPFNSPVTDSGIAERDRLALEAERRRQQELEQKLAAETRDRERLVAEARDRERLAAELEAERKKRAEAEARQLAETRERERLAAEAEAERKKRQGLEEQLAKQERPSAPPPPTASAPRNPHALVIGNAAYPGSGRLDNPINDAQAISQKLRAMGFTVTVVNDADRQRLVQAMSQFRKSASAADLSLLFYSGHGVQIFGTNYILPIDADQSDVAQATIQGISLNSVVENFLPGKTKIVFLDACRDNPLQRAGDRSVSKGLAPISVAQGTLISYATKDGQTASDGVGQKNSPFTTALLQHLSDPEDIGIILRKVREKVMAATGGKQQPWEYGSLTGGALVLSAIKR